VAGAAVTIIIAIAGRPLIELLFGSEFGDASSLLLLLAIATMIRVLAFAADPVLYALNKPQAALSISIATTLLFLIVLLWRIPSDGLMATGIAYLAMSSAATLLSSAVAWSQLRKARNAKLD
jgi:O-antigen/teichoic acid export membrane protein